jgi:hypothetical protein
VDPRRLLPALAAVACACVVATLVVTLVPWREAPSGSRQPSVPASSVSASPAGPAVVLAEWDEHRAAAWASGDDDALAGLYVDGSRTGAADVRLLRHYRSRGLTVTGLTTQVLALDVVATTPNRLVLVVTDRVVGGRAVGGSAPVALPADRASTRRVELRREGGRWRVVEARDQASAAASTLVTSSSSKS